MMPQSRDPRQALALQANNQDIESTGSDIEKLREYGNRVGAMESLLRELQSSVQLFPFDGKSASKVEKFWIYFEAYSIESKISDMVPFKQKFCHQAAMILLEWILNSPSEEEISLVLIVRLLSSQELNFDSTDLHEALSKFRIKVLTLADNCSSFSDLLCEELSRRIPLVAKAFKRSDKFKLLSAIYSNFLKKADKTSREHVYNSLIEHGLFLDNMFDDQTLQDLFIASYCSDQDLASIILSMNGFPIWITKDVEHGIPLVLSKILRAQDPKGNLSLVPTNFVFSHLGGALQVLLGIPEANRWLQMWVISSMKEGVQPRAQATALSLIICIQRQRKRTRKLQNFLDALVSHGVFKCVRDLLTEKDLFFEKSPAPRVHILAQNEALEEESSENRHIEQRGSDKAKDDDEEDSDVPELQSPESDTESPSEHSMTRTENVVKEGVSYAAIVPDLGLLPTPKETFEDLWEMCKVVRMPSWSVHFENFKKISVEFSQTEADLGCASLQNFEDNFADLSSDDEDDHDDENITASKKFEKDDPDTYARDSINSNQTLVATVRFHEQNNDSRTIRTVALHRPPHNVFKLIDRPVADMSWTINGQLPGVLVLGPSKQEVEKIAIQLALNNFENILKRDYLWEILILSLKNGLAEEEQKHIIKFLQRGLSVLQAEPEADLYRQVYRLALQMRAKKIGDDHIDKLIQHFFSKVWRNCIISWDWELEGNPQCNENPCKLHDKNISGSMESESTAWKGIMLHVVSDLATSLSAKDLFHVTGNKEVSVFLHLAVGGHALCFHIDAPAKHGLCLAWVARFQECHSHLLASKEEHPAQEHLQNLLKVCTKNDYPPGLRIAGLSVLRNLVKANHTHYRNWDSSTIDTLVRILANENKTPFRVGAASLLERYSANGSPSGSFPLSHEQHQALCEIKNPSANAWLYATLCTILWLNVGSEQHALRVLTSQIWQRFLDHFENIPAQPRTQAMYAASYHAQGREALVQFAQNHEDVRDIVFDLLSSALHINGALAEELYHAFNISGPELVLFAWAPSLSQSIRDGALKLLEVQDDRQTLYNVLVMFTAAPAMNRAYVRAQSPHLAEAICDMYAQQDDRLGESYLDMASRTLLPVYLSTLHVESDLELLKNLIRVIHETSRGTKLLDLSDAELTLPNLLALEHALNPCTAIEHLVLNGNPGIKNDGAACVANWLSKPGNKIRRLELARCGISCQGFKCIADALRCTKCLEELGIALNDITNQGEDTTSLVALAESLIWNTTLKNLDLSGNLLTQEGLATLARALRYNGAIEKLRLESSSANPLQLTAIDAKLELNRTGLTASPHLGRDSFKKMPRLEREKARQTVRILSGSHKAHKPYDRNQRQSENTQHQDPLLKIGMSSLDKFVRRSVDVARKASQGSVLPTREEELKQEDLSIREHVSSTEIELESILGRIHELKERQCALFSRPVGNETSV